MKNKEAKGLGLYRGDEAILKGNDRRTKLSISQYSQFPFNTIGQIQSLQKQCLPNQPPGEVSATGFLIAKNLVLTSAHNLIMRDVDNSNIRQCVPISFTLLQVRGNGKYLKPISYRVETAKVNMHFIGKLNNIAVMKNMLYCEEDSAIREMYLKKLTALDYDIIPYDFALLKLQKSIELPKYFQLFPHLVDKNEVAVTGYDRGNQLRLLTNSNIFDSIISGGIFYDIDTDQGQSGGPVYLVRDNTKLVGIHNAYWYDKNLNYATMMTESIIKTLMMWAQEMKSSFVESGEKVKMEKELTSQLQRTDSKVQPQYIQHSVKQNEEARTQHQPNPGTFNRRAFSIRMIRKTIQSSNVPIKQQNKVLSNYRKLHQHLKDEIQDDTIQKAKQLSRKGLQFINQNKFAEALEYYKRALNIQERVKGKDSFDCANTIHYIGWVYKKQDKLNQALEYLKRALSIYERVKGKDSFDCAAPLNNIGSVYKKQDKLNQALEYYERALSIYERVKGKDSFDCASTLNNIGSVYDSQGKLNQALEYYERALSIYETVKGKDSFDCGVTLYNIGSVYDSKGKLKQALKYYEKALSIYKIVKGKDSIDFADTLCSIGTVYQRQGKLNQALELINIAKEIYEKAGATKSNEYSYIHQQLSRIYQKLDVTTNMKQIKDTLQ